MRLNLHANPVRAKAQDHVPRSEIAQCRERDFACLPKGPMHLSGEPVHDSRLAAVAQPVPDRIQAATELVPESGRQLTDLADRHHREAKGFEPRELGLAPAHLGGQRALADARYLTRCAQLIDEATEHFVGSPPSTLLSSLARGHRPMLGSRAA